MAIKFKEARMLLSEANKTSVLHESNLWHRIKKDKNLHELIRTVHM